MPERRHQSGGDRRDHTPPGRLRRILFAHGGAGWMLIAGAVVASILFAATSAFAVNERFKRDVTVIAHTHDIRALDFLRDREARGTRSLAQEVRTRDRELAEVADRDAPYLVVSLEEKRVWYIGGTDTIFTAPVAVGSGQTLTVNGRTQRFQTPRGRMTITHKELDPIWVPPAWHFHRIAQRQGLRVVDMSHAPQNSLAGYPPGKEIVRDGAIIIPPYGSPQRRYEGILGAAKLEMRDGYYFHGTQDEGSIGTAASAGCIRLRRDDILWMHENIPVGTEVFIY
jgi:lipoprotein-anchoring transpeptidase ErfK/SrfK